MNAENSTPPYGFRRVAGERVETQAKPGVASSRGTDTAIAQTPAGLGRGAKYCPLCPGWWRLSAITATAQDGSRTTADKVQLKVASSPRIRVPGFRRKGSGPDNSNLSQAERADIVAKNYTLKCPRNHTLVNSAEPTIVVGVIGNVNSSKSHYLVGLIYELIYEQRLAALGADIGYIGDTGTVMDQRINSVYRDGVILNNTERGEVDGPFSYRLSRHVRTSAESKAILTFFDVAGEDCVGLARSADFVRYLFNAAGIIVLVDPGGLPAAGQPLRARGEASLTTRAIIDNLADAMEAVTGRPSYEQDQIISITIAKADSATSQRRSGRLRTIFSRRTTRSPTTQESGSGYENTRTNAGKRCQESAAGVSLVPPSPDSNVLTFSTPPSLRPISRRSTDPGWGPSRSAAASRSLRS